jgi:hypothetical protein
MPYNIEVTRVNHFDCTDVTEFASVPRNEDLPALLRYNTGLLYATDNGEYCVSRIRCASQRPAPIRVKRQRSHIVGEEGERPMAVAAAAVVMTISDETLCTLENRLFCGIYYSFLMTHSLQGEKTSANIGFSTNPMLDVYRHNNLLTNDRTTKAAAPFWVLDMVLGPFPFKEKAVHCSEEWVSGTRGKDSKRKKAALLKIIHNVNLYDSGRPLGVPFRDFLITRAHPLLVKKYDSILASRQKGA